MPVKKVKIEYYKIVARENNDLPNSPDREFDFCYWIKHINDNYTTQKSRVVPYYGEKAVLEKLQYCSESKYWVFKFARLREDNIPKKAWEDKEAEDIELEDGEYIGEEVLAIYDEGIHILAIQRNFHSLGISGIEQYINTLWHNKNQTNIYLRPINPGNNITDSLLKKGIVRKLRVKFADVQNSNIDDFESSAIKDIVNGAKKYNSIGMDIMLTVGRSKDKNLNNEEAGQTIQDIYNNQEYISKAEVGIKERDDEPMEYMDLLADKLTDIILIDVKKRQSIASEYLQNLMWGQYQKSKGKILNLIGIWNE